MNMPTFSKLVLFGDSDSDGGEGANGVYELTRKAWPAPPNFQGRFCNGSVWPEYLAPKLSVIYDPQANFAVGGAKTDMTNVLQGKEFEYTGILAQVQNYVQAHPKVAPQTLFAIWGGGANFFEEGLSFDETVAQAIKDLAESVDLLIKADAQTILLGTQPSMGFSPEMRTKQREAHFHQLTAQFNERLSQGVERWRQKSSTNIILADIAGLATEVLANPARFGFTNITDPCLVDGSVCANGERYLYWDGVHFTTVFQRRVAEEFHSAIVAAYT